MPAPERVDHERKTGERVEDWHQDGAADRPADRVGREGRERRLARAISASAFM